MFQVSKMADYGTVVMAYLANQPNKANTARVIATETHLTLPMVSKILKLLAKAGLLLSERGVQGGYRLAKPAATISVAQIIASVEKPITLTECSGHVPGKCVIEEKCNTKNHWRMLNRTITEALERVSLADIISPLEKNKA